MIIMQHNRCNGCICFKEKWKWTKDFSAQKCNACTTNVKCSTQSNWKWGWKKTGQCTLTCFTQVEFVLHVLWTEAHCKDLRSVNELKHIVKILRRPESYFHCSKIILMMSDGGVSQPQNDFIRNVCTGSRYRRQSSHDKKKQKKKKKGEKMIICNQENISPEYFYSPLKFFKQMPFFINKWKFCTYILSQEFLSLFEIISAILCAQ